MQKQITIYDLISELVHYWKLEETIRNHPEYPNIPIYINQEPKWTHKPRVPYFIITEYTDRYTIGYVYGNVGANYISYDRYNHHITQGPVA